MIAEPERVTFLVPGEPIPQGSSRAVTNPRTGLTTIISDNPRLRGWRREVRRVAKFYLTESRGYPLAGPVELHLLFRMPAPKALSRAKRHTTEPAKLPDVDKLTRAVFDALSKDRATPGVGYTDDGQVTRVRAEKVYAVEDGEMGVIVTIGPSRKAPLL